MSTKEVDEQLLDVQNHGARGQISRQGPLRSVAQMSGTVLVVASP